MQKEKKQAEGNKIFEGYKILMNSFMELVQLDQGFIMQTYLKPFQELEGG